MTSPLTNAAPDESTTSQLTPLLSLQRRRNNLADAARDGDADKGLEPIARSLHEVLGEVQHPGHATIDEGGAPVQ